MFKDAVLLNNLTKGLYDPDALDEGARVQVDIQFQALFRNYENLFHLSLSFLSGALGPHERPCGESRSSSGPMGTTPVGLMVPWLS